MKADQTTAALDRLPALHLALAAAVALGSLALALPVWAGWSALVHPERYADRYLPEAPPTPSLPGWLFLVGGALAILLGLALAAGLVAAGRAIRRRTGHGLCLGVAAAATFAFPFGTLLGFHALDVLTRPGARDLFRSGPRGA